MAFNKSASLPAVSARGVDKSFGRIKVLDDLTVDIPRGVTYCLLGPNGSGKTTFIRAIVGMLKLNGGDLTVLGQPVSQVQTIYSRIGYMTQHKALYPDLTLQENLEFFAGLYSIEKQERERRITDLLDMVNLLEHRHRLAGDLSGGMYQRLSLACTLIHEPELLLLDEPTVGVDPRLRQTFWNYFDRLTAEGKTVLITTHLMDEAEKCKTVGYMRAGRMTAVGSPDEIKRLAGLKPHLELWLKEPEKDAARLKDLGYEIDEVDVAKGLVQVRLQGHDQIKGLLERVAPLDMRLKEPTLEEAFLRLSEAA
jgi:ABC-2 type transport system ATP-binding protein